MSDRNHIDHSAIGYGLGPFLTWIETQAGDRPGLQTSRRQRKRLKPLRITAATPSPLDACGNVRHNWSRIWAPDRLGWWTAALFMIGSALFAVGGFCAAWPDIPALRWITPPAINPIFFVGSLFFTTAAYLQFYEVLNGDITVKGAPRRFVGWRPRNLGYLAALVQLIGTLLFNRSTGDALLPGLEWRVQNLLVWRPDIIGSICFLASSQLAVMEYAHSWFAFRPEQLTWWIVAANMLGSILFMVSAIASFVVPAGNLFAPFLANAGTFGGAVCFLLGAYLLIPEQAVSEW